jgi:hypothetical protein
LNRIRKNHVSLPSFNVLQPLVGLAIVVHGDAQKNTTELSSARRLAKNLAITLIIGLPPARKKAPEGFRRRQVTYNSRDAFKREDRFSAKG